MKEKNAKKEHKEKQIIEVKEEDEPPSQGHKKCILDIEAEARFVTEGRIFVIGLMEEDNGTNHIFYDKNEEVLVRRFINYFNKNAFEKIIGYNTPYDYRHIFSACMKYCIPLGHFYHADIIDIMQILKNVKNTNNFNKAGTLHQWSIYLFNEGKAQKNGSVSRLFHEGKINELISYNKKDLQLTHMLWKRIKHVLGHQDSQETVNFSREFPRKYLSKQSIHYHNVSHEAVAPVQMLPQFGFIVGGYYE